MPTIWWPFPSRPKSPTFVRTGCPYFKRVSHLRRPTEIGHGLSVGMCKCTGCCLWILTFICKVLLFQFVWIGARFTWSMCVWMSLGWFLRSMSPSQSCSVQLLPNDVSGDCFQGCLVKTICAARCTKVLTRLTRFRFCHKSTFALVLEVKDESTMESVLDEFSTTSWYQQRTQRQPWCCVAPC